MLPVLYVTCFVCYLVCMLPALYVTCYLPGMYYLVLLRVTRYQVVAVDGTPRGGSGTTGRSQPASRTGQNCSNTTVVRNFLRTRCVSGC